MSLNYQAIYDLFPPSGLGISIKSTVLLALTLATFKLSLSLYRNSRFRSATMSSSSSRNDSESLRRDRILSSKLYLAVPNSKVPLIYSSTYNITFLGIENLHPFDSAKWGRIIEFLIEDGVLDKHCIVEPLEASKNDLLVVYTYLKLS